MKRYVVAVVALLLVPAMSLGAVMTLTGGTKLLGSSGGSITVGMDLALATGDAGPAGYEARILSSLSGACSITARAWGDTFNPDNGDFALQTSVTGSLAPKSKNLGCLAMADPEADPPKMDYYDPELYPSTLETITLNVPSSQAGKVFTLSLSDVLLSDNLGDPINITTAGVVIVDVLAGKASGPGPVDAAMDVALDVVMNWAAGAGASKYNVYMAKLGDSLVSVSAGQTGTAYDPPGDLLPNTTYQWRVDSLNQSNRANAGPLWTFTTLPEPITLLLLGLGGLFLRPRRS